MKQVAMPENNLKKAGIKAAGTDHYFFLDFIRVVSILMIILYHFNGEVQATHPGAKLIFGRELFHQAVGDVGVTLFIILSGASLMISTATSFSVPDFFKKRALSIFPSYWVTYFAVCTGLFLIRGSIVGDYPHWTFLLTLAGLDGFLSYKIPDYYLVGEWFVGFILCLYVFFPVLRKGIINWPVLTWVVVLVLFFVLHKNYGGFFDLAETRNPLIRLPEFLFGMYFAKYLLRFNLYTFFVSVIMLAVFLHWVPPSHIQIYGILLGIALFFVLAFIGNSVIFPAMTKRFFESASKYSFAAFLVHHQLIYNLLPHFYLSLFSRIEMWFLFVLILAFSFGSAVLLHKIIPHVNGVLRKLLYKAAAI